jgi:SAM-dependent methyltransferase
MGESDPGYQYGSGIGEDELARLEAQGAAMATATRMIFAQAGIRPGMRVLDLGCGAGDASFVAADLVGPGGSVVGVDRSPGALARARLRAAQRGLDWVRFVEGDLQDPAPGGPFDAIVERLVLMWVPDPAALLRQQARALRPGGLVVPIEVDVSTMRWLPATPLGTQVRSWLVEAFAKAGIATLGPQLRAIVQQAGLRPLGTIGVQPHFEPGDPVGIAAVAENIRIAAPLIISAGVATAEEIGLETFEQRLRDEQQRSQAVSATPMLLSTWATPSTERDHACPLLEATFPSCGHHGPFRLKISIFMERTVALRQRLTMSLLWGHGDQR